MNNAPKVLTRMRLSCCWGDNLNEKELNDVVDYINGLERQCKKQKEVIDKAIEYIENEKHKQKCIGFYTKKIHNGLLDILNEVSE